MYLKAHMSVKSVVSNKERVTWVFFWTYVCSHRLPLTSHTGHKGRVCSGQSLLWSRVQMCDAVAGLGRACQAAGPDRKDSSEGCPEGPTG